MRDEIFVASGIVPYFLVSNMGRIYDTRSKRYRKSRINVGTGYREICTNIDKKQKYFLLHRLVANEFCEMPKDGKEYEVNHINADRSDARAENLEWITHGENLKYAYEIGNRDNDVSPRGVIAINIETGEQQTFPSIYRAARTLKISQGNICMACQKKRPYAGSYYWQYKEA